MRRRDFIAGFAGAAAWPMSPRAQQAAMPVIGYLQTRSQQSFVPYLAAQLKALNEAGYVEGRNVAIEYRSADGEYSRLPALAADLVSRQVAVLMAGGGELSALAAKAATSTIPIVFTIGSDPVKAGLVASFNRPGANITGINILTDDLEAKRLGLLHTALGLKVHVLAASTEPEIDTVFEAIAREQIPALMVGADPFLDNQRDKLHAPPSERPATVPRNLPCVSISTIELPRSCRQTRLPSISARKAPPPRGSKLLMSAFLVGWQVTRIVGPPGRATRVRNIRA